MSGRLRETNIQAQKRCIFHGLLTSESLKNGVCNTQVNFKSKLAYGDTFHDATWSVLADGLPTPDTLRLKVPVT